MRARVMRALRGQLAEDDPCAAQLRALAARRWRTARRAAGRWAMTRGACASRPSMPSTTGSPASCRSPRAPAGCSRSQTRRRALPARRAARAHGRGGRAAAAGGHRSCCSSGSTTTGAASRALAQMLAGRGHWLRFVLEHPPADLCRRVAASLAAVIATRAWRAARAHAAALRAAGAGAARGLQRSGARPLTCRRWKELARPRRRPVRAMAHAPQRQAPGRSRSPPPRRASS